MITTNEMQLKALIKNEAARTKITPQAALQIYCLERLLERIANSDKRDCFIIKGGFLISSLIGIEHRSTMDIDTTIKGFTVTKENLSKIFVQICNIKIEDQLNFVFDRIEDIRETDDYPGIRVFLFAEYGKMKTSLTVDVTTGDSIVPSEIRYSYKCVFDDKIIPIMAYPIENILAEKLETVISRGTANTRPRDFYDIYMLYSLKKDSINWKNLKSALISTAKKRGSVEVIKDYAKIIETIKEDPIQNNFWKNYSAKNYFAGKIEFTDTLTIVLNCFKIVNM
jgi:predicted nucleotidyltransferase component of viral defense system